MRHLFNKNLKKKVSLLYPIFMQFAINLCCFSQNNIKLMLVFKKNAFVFFTQQIYDISKVRPFLLFTIYSKISTLIYSLVLFYYPTP